MAIWRGWLRQPQRVWLRRAAFQVHLWIGLAICLYIVMLSITGSALVYRNELDRVFATPRPQYDPKATVLTSDFVGLVPALMFVTGVVMWWSRVLGRRLVREVEEPAA